MGVGYPSRREADRLERWPQRTELEDLRESFALGDSDRDLVFGPRGAENRLGLAVQLCALRFLGFVPDEITGIPEPALRFLCEQTETEPHELLPYGGYSQDTPETANSRLRPLAANCGVIGWLRR